MTLNYAESEARETKGVSKDVGGYNIVHSTVLIMMIDAWKAGGGWVPLGTTETLPTETKQIAVKGRSIHVYERVLCYNNVWLCSDCAFNCSVDRDPCKSLGTLGPGAIILKWRGTVPH